MSQSFSLNPNLPKLDLKKNIRTPSIDLPSTSTRFTNTDRTSAFKFWKTIDLPILKQKIQLSQHNQFLFRQLQSQKVKKRQNIRIIKRTNQIYNHIQNQAATQIQRTFRGYFTRKKLEDELRNIKKKTLEIHLQVMKKTCFSLDKRDLVTPGIIIQKNVRRWLAIKLKKRLIDNQIKQKAMLRIQKSTRIYLNNCRFRNNLQRLRRESTLSKISEKVRWLAFLSWWKIYRWNIRVIRQKEEALRKENRPPSPIIQSESITSIESSLDRSQTSFGETPQVPGTPEQSPSPGLNPGKKLPPHYLKPTKAYLNRKEKPITPPESPIIFPPPAHVMKLTINRKLYKEKTKKFQSVSPRWVPAKAYSARLPRALPPIPKKKHRMPEYVVGQEVAHKRRQTIVQKTVTQIMSESEESDESADYNWAGKTTLGFNEALPSLHSIIRSYGQGISN